MPQDMPPEISQDSPQINHPADFITALPDRMLASLSGSAGRLYDLSARFSLQIGMGLSVILFSISTALHFTQRASLAEFFVAAITIVPVSSLSRYATQHLVIKLQRDNYELLSAVINGLLGNMTELCFVLSAVAKRESVIAQTAMTGALLSSCLMVFGVCLFFGGLQQERQYYPIEIARANAQLLVVSLVSIVVPTAFQNWSEGGESGLLTVSRGSAIVLLIEFASYIWFVYLSHTQNPDMKPALVALAAPSFSVVEVSVPLVSRPQYLRELRAVAQEAILKRKATKAEEQEQPNNIYASILILMLSAPALVFASIYLLEAVHTPSEKLKLSESFVGLVTIPSILATMDHVAAVVRSQKEGIAWVIEAAFGSAIRISLFVFPLAVILGWGLGVNIGMIFDGFQVAVLGLAILGVNHVVHNGSAGWLEGTIFISSFLLFAIAAWFYPNNA